MDFKKMTLISGDCLTEVNVSTTYGDMVTLTVSELDVDQEKSTKDTTHYKEVSTTEVYLGPSEVVELINALTFINHKEVI